ncbi:hypothetical protein [Microcoleus sp. MOSTC5]
MSTSNVKSSKTFCSPMCDRTSLITAWLIPAVERCQLISIT